MALLWGIFGERFISQAPNIPDLTQLDLKELVYDNNPTALRNWNQTSKAQPEISITIFGLMARNRMKRVSGEERPMYTYIICNDMGWYCIVAYF
jgi:hypothetical protein